MSLRPDGRGDSRRISRDHDSYEMQPQAQPQATRWRDPTDNHHYNIGGGGGGGRYYVIKESGMIGGGGGRGGRDSPPTVLGSPSRGSIGEAINPMHRDQFDTLAHHTDDVGGHGAHEDDRFDPEPSSYEPRARRRVNAENSTAHGQNRGARFGTMTAEMRRKFSMRSATLAKNIYEKVQALNGRLAEADMPGWDSKIGEYVIKWTFLRLPIPLILVLAAFAAPVGVAFMYSDDPPVFDISLTSFTVPDHPQALAMDAAYAAKSVCSGSSCPTATCPSSSTRRTRRGKSWKWQPSWDGGTFDTSGGDGSVEDGSILSRNRREDAFKIAVVYRGIKTGNVLTPEGVRDMHDIERGFSIYARGTGTTVQMNTITAYLYPPTGQYGSPARLLSPDEITSRLDYAAGSTTQANMPDPIGPLLFELGSNFAKKQGVYSSEYIRSEIVIQSSTSDALTASWIGHLEESQTENVGVIYAAREIFNYQILEMLYSDIFFVVYALIFVASYMLWHTQSLFLTLVGMFNILCAFPVGYFLYRECFGGVNLSILCAVTLFVVVGIGVDDIFVFIDMFKQLDPSVSLEERMVHCMVTAARATLFTTVTSASAFAANSLSEIPALSDFGLLTALIISSNYVLLVLVIPATLGFWWRYVKPTEDCIGAGIKWLVLCPFHCCMGGDGDDDDDDDVDESGMSNKSSLGSISVYPKRKQRRNRGAELLDEEDLTDSYLLPGQASELRNGKPPPGYAKPPNFDGSAPKDSLEPERKRKQPKATKAGPKVSVAVAKLQAANAKNDRGKGTGKRGEGEPASGLDCFSWALYHLNGAIVVRGRWVVLAVYFVFTIVVMQQATLLQPAKKPPALVPDDSNLGRVDALASKFDNWDSSGGNLAGSVTDNGGDIIVGQTVPTPSPITSAPTNSQPTYAPTTSQPTYAPVPSPTKVPTTTQPTNDPTTAQPTKAPSTSAPTDLLETLAPTTPKPTKQPNSAPTLAPTGAPSTSVPTQACDPGCTDAPTPDPGVTVPPLDGAANDDISFVFGLATPAVDRSQADLTDFTEDKKAYLPLFDASFNKGGAATVALYGTSAFLTGGPIYAPFSNSHIESALGIQVLRFCDQLVNDSSIIFPGQSCDRLVFSEYGVQARDCGNPAALNGTIFLWFKFELKGTFKSTTSSSEVMKSYDAVQAVLAAAQSEYPLLSSVAVSSKTYELAVYEMLAIDGSIWGILISLLLCFIAVCLFKAHATVVVITMTVIIANVATVVAIFHWQGWTLGGVEAISLSILVGTCVDYAIHMMEGYLEANPEHRRGLRAQSLRDLLRVETDAQLRFWRVRQAISSVGVPVCSSAITTAGSGAFLTMCQIQIFKRFGEIIVINTVVSIVLTLTLLPALLAALGPAGFKSSAKRSILAVLALGCIVGTIVLILYLMAQDGNRIRGPTGDFVF